MNYLTTSQEQKQIFANWIMEQVTVLAAAFNTVVSAETLQIYAQDLGDIPQPSLELAFTKSRRELKFFPKIAEIRNLAGESFDGRPGPEEAWARMPKGERMELDTVVWCEEERDAYEACRPLLANDDVIAARMCFLEKYRAGVEQSRVRGRALVWSVSCGYDQSHRILKIAEAVNAKRLPANIASAWIPLERMNEFARLLPESDSSTLLLAGTVDVAKELPGFYGLLQKMRVDKTLPDGCEPADKPAERDPLTKEQLADRKEVLRQQAAELTKRKVS